MKSTSLYLHKGKIYKKPTGFKRRGYILLMSTPASIHILTAALSIKANDPNRGVKARAVVMKFSTSTWVTVPLGTVTIMLADIATFNNAVGAARITAWNVINTGLKAVKNLFSDAMGEDPVNAREICLSGGFKVKGQPIKQQQVFGIVQGASGTIEATGDIIPGKHCHDWLLSPNGITYIRQRPTPNSKKQFPGLAPGRWFVQHQCIGSGSVDGPFQTLFIDLI